MDEANSVLAKIFLPWFNRCCTVKPTSRNNAHRPLGPSMKPDSILSIQVKRKVANDYTIRFDNRLYQLLPPAVPGLRGGRVTVEKRSNGRIYISFKGRYLKYKMLGLADAPGALPPNPRGLSPLRCPAEIGKGDAATPPSAGSSTSRRSGCSSAEPCPSAGKNESNKKKSYRPSSDHPWRRSRKKGKKKKSVA